MRRWPMAAIDATPETGTVPTGSTVASIAGFGVGTFSQPPTTTAARRRTIGLASGRCSRRRQPGLRSPRPCGRLRQAQASGTPTAITARCTSTSCARRHASTSRLRTARRSGRAVAPRARDRQAPAGARRRDVACCLQVQRPVEDVRHPQRFDESRSRSSARSARPRPAPIWPRAGRRAAPAGGDEREASEGAAPQRRRARDCRLETAVAT